MKNFINLVLAGEEIVDEIDAYIEEWHESDTALEIHEYLGMTQDEYSLWVENPSLIGRILFSRKGGVDVMSNASSETHLMAARSHSQQDPEVFAEWLREKGF